MINLIVPLTDLLTALAFVYLVYNMATSDLSSKLTRMQGQNTIGTYEVLRIMKGTASNGDSKNIVVCESNKTYSKTDKHSDTQ